MTVCWNKVINKYNDVLLLLQFIQKLVYKFTGKRITPTSESSQPGNCHPGHLPPEHFPPGSFPINKNCSGLQWCTHGKLAPVVKKTTTKKIHQNGRHPRIKPAASKVKTPTPAKPETPQKLEEAKASSDAVVAEGEQLPKTETTPKPKRRGFNLPRRGGSRVKAQKTEKTASQPTTVERTRTRGRAQAASPDRTVAKPSTPQRNARFRPNASRGRTTARATEAPSVVADDVASTGSEPATPSGRGTPRVRNGRIPARRQLRGRTTTPSPEPSLPEEEVTKSIDADAEAEAKPSNGRHRNARRFPTLRKRSWMTPMYL